jgi:glutamate 5-kinase
VDILVIKFGTASITRKNGEPDEEIIASIAQQVSELHPKHHIIIVSSGAVGAGKSSIQKYTGSLTQRKAAAAVGNPILVSLYAKHFAPFGISIAQGLCERQHFGNRAQFLQLKDTFETLWKSGIIPIVNENDVVSDRELKFSDNDELATLLAAGFGAKTLMLCTSLGGLLDSDQTVIPTIDDINNAFQFVNAEKSELGLGGMTSKLTFAKLAMRMGIRVVIFGMGSKNSLLDAYSSLAGTQIPAQKSSLNARNRWLGSGGYVTGKIYVDAGAVNAIKKRKSLLAVGIIRVEGDFEAGEIVEIHDAETAGNIIAVAKTRVSSIHIQNNSQIKNLDVVHANDIVLM